MAQTFIPGWELTFTIDSKDFTVVANAFGINRSKASLPKPVFGTQDRNAISGQISGTMSAGGHVSVEKLPDLEAVFRSEIPVALTVQVGTLAGATEAGDYAGNIVVNTYDLATDPEGEWEWTFAADIDGILAYTPPTP